MPHFAVDESAHAHRKVMRAGNAAFGLWVRFGSYACDHLTDGVIPAEIAAMYGTAPQLAKLTKLGMLHGAGHGCPRCAQPEPGDYVVHDYLGPNASRAEIERRREKAAEKKRGQRAAVESTKNRGGNEDDSSANRDGNADENASNQTPFFGDSPGHEGASPGDGFQTRARPRPSPSPSPASPTEKLASKGARSATAGPDIPDFGRPLVDQMTAAGMVVSWRLSEVEWFAIHAHIKRASTAAMVAFTRDRWNPADPPKTARYLTRIWADMPDLPEGTPTQPAPLPAVVGSDVVPFRDRQQQASDDMFDRAMARAEARMQQESS
ncbi:mucin-2 [Streptomyces sp. NPDC005970]|uniref:mucin-2 n=1 Tax=Streptomyces sp. NPDC005970 TaxID=3156723 RepID=UPI0033EC2D70